MNQGWVKSYPQNEGSELSKILQTTLDVYDLLKHFHRVLQQHIPYHSFQFNNDQTKHGLSMGAIQAFEACFELTLQDECLGHLRLTKPSAFSEDERKTIENALNQLIYPLRNAILYHTVAIHAVTCSLTQLGNRSLFDQTIQREMDLAIRHKSTFALLLLDIDDFKQINDIHGHLAGDTVLQQVGKILQNLKRQSDYVFRYGGEEFILILSQSNTDGAALVAERIRQQISHHEFVFEGKTITITASIGLSHFYPEDNFKSLFQRVDRALYQAKEEGKNRIITD